MLAIWLSKCPESCFANLQNLPESAAEIGALAHSDQQKKTATSGANAAKLVRGSGIIKYCQ